MLSERMGKYERVGKWCGKWASIKGWVECARRYDMWCESYDDCMRRYDI